MIAGNRRRRGNNASLFSVGIGMVPQITERGRHWRAALVARLSVEHDKQAGDDHETDDEALQQRAAGAHAVLCPNTLDLGSMGPKRLLGP